MRHDPRIRQNLDRISTSLESAAEDARTGCFTFTKSYIEPCFSSLIDCCTSCLPKPKVAHHHHHRNRYARSRSEYPFGFYEYDDWESDDDEGGGFLAWGTDELDRLLAGSGSGTPAVRNERMYYGAAGDAVGTGLRRKNTMSGRDSPDPTVIPGTSMFGFLSRFGVRGKGMRYKPSAANLQEHPQRSGAADVAFVGPSKNGRGGNGNGRKRSGTGSSAGSQGDSLRSRGDLWPSEDEDDAVVIGDDAFPRSSDGDSAEVMGLGIGSDDDCARQEDLLVEDAEEERRRMRKHTRLAMRRGFSAGSIEESNTRNIYSKGSNSAPPTILATSPEPYPTGLGITASRPESVKSREGSIYQQIQRPRVQARKEKGKENVSDTSSTPRPQMRQVPSTHSPIPPTSPAAPSLTDAELTPRASGKEWPTTANDDDDDMSDDEN